MRSSATTTASKTSGPARYQSNAEIAIRPTYKPEAQARGPAADKVYCLEVIMSERVYIVRPAVFAPTILSLIFVVLCLRESWWFLAALPFVWLGSICAQPNLNLVNGCLAYVSIVVGFALVMLFKPLGLAILAGSLSGFYISAVEKRLRARPI